MAEKIYVGRAKYIQTRFGDLCKIWLTPEGVDLINQNVKNDGGINLTMTEMREPDRANNTHVLYVDDYVPNSGGRAGGRTQHGRGQAPQRGQRQESQGRQSQRPPARGGNGRNNGGFEEEQPPQNEHKYSEQDAPGYEPPQEDPFEPDEMTDADIPF